MEWTSAAWTERERQLLQNMQRRETGRSCYEKLLEKDIIGLSIDREFEFYEFFSFLKFNEFYEFFSVEKNSEKIANQNV